jgi:hypothetical protein
MFIAAFVGLYVPFVITQSSSGGMCVMVPLDFKLISLPGVALEACV